MLGWLSLTSLPFAFFDGTIHANPFALQFLVTADASGHWFIATGWPTGVPTGVPTGTELGIQFLIDDAARRHRTLQRHQGHHALTSDQADASKSRSPDKTVDVTRM